MSRRRVLTACVAVLALVIGVLAWTTPIVPLLRYLPAPSSAAVPVAGVRLDRIESSWGAPRDGGRRHEGVDIAAPRGTPVISITDGEVLRTGVNPLGGNVVWTIGEGGALYYYAHLDHHADGIAAGRPLRRGDVIGYVGNSGNAARTPPHLHLGVYPLVESFGAVDPVPLLRAWNAQALDR